METTDSQTLTERRKRDRNIVVIAVIVVILVLLLPFLTGWGGNATASTVGQQTSGSTSSPTPTPSSTPTPTPSPSPEACDPQYVQVAGTNENGAVMDDFEEQLFATLAEGNTFSEATQAVFIEASGKNAMRLASWAHRLGLYEAPDNYDALIDGECLSSEGISLHNQFIGALSSTGTKIEEVEEVPADYFNSGIANGVYGVSDTAGIYGDRRGIRVTLQDGSVAYFLIRCANPLYANKPDLPVVPTDNPPPPVTPPPVVPPTTEVPKCPPGMTGKPPNCKDPATNDPAPSGNAPVGGGQNFDPGPGVYVPPEQMEQPPAPPRVNPPAPAPAPPAPAPAPPAPAPQPEPVPTLDPAPPAPPAPDPGPPPTAPEPVCDPTAPGATCP